MIEITIGIMVICFIIGYVFGEIRHRLRVLENWEVEQDDAIDNLYEILVCTCGEEDESLTKAKK